MNPTTKLVGTPLSQTLCEEISKASDGVCILAFSRGKDSTVAWLYLRQFFKKIIPFHLASVPHLGFVDRSLDYFEEYFDTKIERLMNSECLSGLSKLWYQPGEDEEELDKLETWEYELYHIADLLKEKYGVPKAWCANGVSMFDSLFRRLRFRKDGVKAAKREELMMFYPCFDWSMDRITYTIHKAGISLPEDYLMGDRTLNDLPAIKHLVPMKVLYPEDFKKVKNMFPFIEARIARNFFRAKNLGKEKELGKGYDDCILNYRVNNRA